MGCHMWLYKKAKSLTTEEKIKLVNSGLSYRTFVQNVTREEFIKEQVLRWKKDLRKLQKFVDSGDMDPNDPQYEIAKEFSNPNKVGKWYDESVEINKKRKEAYEAFIKNPEITSEEFIKLYKTIGKDSSVDTRFYKGEWYVHTGFDYCFRCYHYGEDLIDNYKDMIKYLEPLSPEMIIQYGNLNENGEYNDLKSFKKGLTSELRKTLRSLYRNNDIFIEFG